jgi:hypothetical protein
MEEGLTSARSWFSNASSLLTAGVVLPSFSWAIAPSSVACRALPCPRLISPESTQARTRWAIVAICSCADRTVTVTVVVSVMLPDVTV